MMKRALAVLAVAVCAFTAAAQSISLSPSTIKVNSGEQFLTINGTGLSGQVTFSGPAGTFTLDANRVTSTYAAVWIPLQVTFKSGIYNVSMGNSTVATLTVQGVKTFNLAIISPEFLWYQPLNREGTYVRYDVVVSGGEDPNPVVNCSPKSGEFFKWGTTSVYCAATNSYGERAEAVFPVNVSDRVGPIVKVPESIYAKPQSHEGAIVDFEASAFDEIYGEVYTSCYPKSGSMFKIGTTLVGCTAVDRDGNEAGAFFNVQVSDDEPRPLVVVVPETIYATARDPRGEYVKYDVWVEKSEDPEPQITCTQDSGTIFPVGTSHVTCTALDRYGSRGEASFDVEVIDPEAPVIEKMYATPDVLRYDGQMQDVTITVSAYDAIDSAPQCSIYAVTSNETIDIGDNGKQYDYMVTGPLTLQLRGTRRGLTRYYHVWVNCTDFYGNIGGGRTTVTVP